MIAIFPHFPVLLALALLLIVPSVCLCAKLVLLSPSQIGFPLPNLSSVHSHFISAIGGKKIFVKFRSEIRPLFVAFATLEAPYLYVDQSENIRSVEHAVVEQFIKEKLKMDARNFNRLKLRSAIQDALIALPPPPVERSMRHGSNYKINCDGSFQSDAAVIFEYCNENVKSDDNKPSCLYFFLSDGDDQVSLECFKLFKARPRLSAKFLIKQMNWAESDQWLNKQNGKCKRVEPGIVMKRSGKMEDMDLSTAMETLFGKE
ncbi:hypothetical protein niasHS_006226 [Heterodera schachtii]|uniref:Uncharacterized protein n=1 Tax=Heterodera schachtii TaxID=97005 RepID=A0ABD2JSU6_HETSC